jgi:hypothetical protein
MGGISLVVGGEATGGLAIGSKHSIRAARA